MSLFIGAVFANFAMLATDSWCSGDRSRHVGKLHLLGLAGAVITGRGSAAHIHAVVGACNQSGAGFDELMKLLPSFIAETGGAGEEHGRPALWRGAEFCIAGWSEVTQAPALCGFAQPSLGGDVDVMLGDPGFVLCAPWTAAMGSLPTVDDLGTADGVVAVARRQKHAMDEAFPPRAAGGPLIVAQVFRTHVEVVRLCDLDPDPIAPSLNAAAA